MEILLDTANLEKIKSMIDQFPISGVTTNPTLISKEMNTDFFDHIKKIRLLIGVERSLHVQILGEDTETMLIEAELLVHHIDSNVYIKVPATKEGIKTIQILKSKGFNVTATCIYSKMQAVYAIMSGADYIAPYVNRMANLDINPFETLLFIQRFIDKHSYKTKIVGASFKNLTQLIDSIDCGIVSITVDPNLIDEIFKVASIDLAVKMFKSNFENQYGVNSLSKL